MTVFIFKWKIPILSEILNSQLHWKEIKLFQKIFSNVVEILILQRVYTLESFIYAKVNLFLPEVNLFELKLTIF